MLHRQDAYFVDLFVRVSNTTAIGMYERLGYVVYRRIIDYYSGDGTSPDEDAFGVCSFLSDVSQCLTRVVADMRKSLSRDPEKKFMVPLKNPVPFDDAFTL
jgi:N-terminal acetyltransferase B complex catalytic subunit